MLQSFGGVVPTDDSRTNLPLANGDGSAASQTGTGEEEGGGGGGAATESLGVGSLSVDVTQMEDHERERLDEELCEVERMIDDLPGPMTALKRLMLQYVAGQNEEEEETTLPWQMQDPAGTYLRRATPPVIQSDGIVVPPGSLSQSTSAAAGTAGTGGDDGSAGVRQQSVNGSGASTAEGKVEGTGGTATGGPPPTANSIHGLEGRDGTPFTNLPRISMERIDRGGATSGPPPSSSSSSSLPATRKQKLQNNYLDPFLALVECAALCLEGDFKQRQLLAMVVSNMESVMGRRKDGTIRSGQPASPAAKSAVRVIRAALRQLAQDKVKLVRELAISVAKNATWLSVGSTDDIQYPLRATDV